MIRALTLSMAMTAGAATADSHLLNADALAALVDQRVAELSPYEAILNDPDPARSMAAMEIMLASGDPTLFRSAVNFGFQAADPALQRMAAKGVLDSGVPITIALSGVPEEGQANFADRTRSYLGAAVSPDGVAYISVAIGAYSPEKGCYLVAAPEADNCVATLNADGIFVQFPNFSARLGFGEGAALSGAATVAFVGEPIQADLKLLE